MYRPRQGPSRENRDSNHRGRTEVLFHSASVVVEVHTFLHIIIMPFHYYAWFRTSAKEVPRNKDMSLCELKYPSYTAYLRYILNPAQAGWPAHHTPVRSRHCIHSAQRTKRRPRWITQCFQGHNLSITMKMDGEISKKVVSPWKHRERSNVLITFKFSAKW